MYADLSLIRDYTPEDDRIGRPVVVTHFKKKGKSLYYINAHHGSGIDNPTCETARKAIEACGPRMVVIEGFPTENGISSLSYIDYANRQAAQKFPDGEPAYAALCAYQRGIPFVGGEPSNAQICSAMKKEGYTAKDITAFCLLRQISQDRREGDTMDGARLSERAAHYINRAFDFIPATARLTLPEFEAWYKSHSRGGKHFLEISPNDIAPFPPPFGDYFQRLNHRIGIVRERHLDTLIAESLASHDRVLVVYGDGHLVKSRAVFEKMLGPGASMQIATKQRTEKQRPARPGHGVRPQKQSDTASPR